MAISAYVGIPGSGKSYEVVSSVIIPACLAGRRIVTNIYGLSPDKIYAHCEKTKKTQRDALGEIVVISNEQAQDVEFFPYKVESGISPNSFCQAGDLICIDEAWRIWGADKEIPDNHRSFIAEHRHFASVADGTTCDLVVMNQSVANLPRFIKDRIETTYSMHKLVALGLHSRYRVEVYSGIKLFKKNLTSKYQCKYDKAIFPLYQSYENGQGNERVVDKRQNVFASTKLWVMVIGLLALSIVSVGYLIWFFTSMNGAKEDDMSVTEGQSAVVQPALNTVAPVTEAPKSSSIWRIAGRLRRDGQAWVILANTDGRLRVEPASQFNFEGLMMTGEIDGQTVTVYSGAIK